MNKILLFIGALATLPIIHRFYTWRKYEKILNIRIPTPQSLYMLYDKWDKIINQVVTHIDDIVCTVDAIHLITNERLVEVSYTLDDLDIAVSKASNGGSVVTVRSNHHMFPLYMKHVLNR